MQEFKFEIPAGDWYEEWAREEDTFQDEDALLNKLKREGAASVARKYLVSREVGASDKELLPPNKLALNTGAAVTLSQIVARRRTALTMPNGRQYEVRENVMPVHEDDDGDEMEIGFVSVADQPNEAMGRARDYLFKRVMRGYVWGRMKIIAGLGGDMEELADDLKAEVDDMVARLVGQPLGE